MDYFFDGVPPLGQVPFEADLLDPDSQQPDQTGQTPTWYVHEPRKDCTNCHRKRRTGGFSAQTYLTAPVPELCHNCHAASMIELIPRSSSGANIGMYGLSQSTFRLDKGALKRDFERNPEHKRKAHE